MPKIELAAYKGREQAFVKHCLLGEYLPQLGFKAGSAWDSICYVDGFAGPWGVTRPDLSDSSFAVAIDSLRMARDSIEANGKSLRVQSILVESDPDAFKKLKTFADARSVPGFRVIAKNGEFESLVPDIMKDVQRMGSRTFQFVFLDPKGWSQIPIGAMAPLLKGRSSEVLINLMTKHITRFLGQPTRKQSYEKLFGRPAVLNTLEKLAPGDERTDFAVREYCRSLQQLCGFEYVSQAIILSPDRDEIRYFLIYGTNHHRGVEVFKSAEIEAARIQEAVRQQVQLESQRQFSMFDTESRESPFLLGLRKRYCARARRKVIDRILASGHPEGIPFRKLFCDAMAFPFTTPEDLHAWLHSFKPHIKIELAGSPKRKKPSADHDDRVFLENHMALNALRHELTGTASEEYLVPDVDDDPEL
jgi:three-Cys-motif partner protein